MDRKTWLVALFAAELAIVALAVQAVRGSAIWPRWSSPAPVETTMSAPAPASPGSTITIALPGAALTLSPSSDGQVHLEETQAKGGWWWGGDPKRRVIHIDPAFGGMRIWRDALFAVGYKEGTDKVALAVPPGSRINVTAAETITAAGFRNALTLHAVEGPVYVRDQHGDLNVSSERGRIVLDETEANRIALSTRDGRLIGTRVSMRGPAPRLDATTTDGRVEMQMKQLPRDGQYMVHTGSGRMRLELPSDSNVTVTMRTGDGDISATGVALTGQGKERRAVFGDGAAAFDLSTGDGRIELTSGSSE
ncbi:MAG: DUF4097 family beta strand repeat protein [Candidatus Eremiobacteraeota bacterium]|nr:DUF4097 family beta strand repeat protein [Candidatus Eremiobacteraeota bacterium]